MTYLGLPCASLAPKMRVVEWEGSTRGPVVETVANCLNSL